MTNGTIPRGQLCHSFIIFLHRSFAIDEKAISTFARELRFLFDRSAGQYLGADHGRGYSFVRTEIAQDDDTFFPVLGKTDCDHLLFEVERLV